MKKKGDKKGEPHAQCMRLDIYVDIELNLIPMVVIIEIFLFFMSNEIFLTLQIVTPDTKFLENSYAVFKLKSQINCFKFII